jgi:hypothetical protein
MNKLDWKEKMRRIKYANKKAGEGWGKAKIKIAAEMILATQGKKATFQDKPEPNKIGDILKTFNLTPSPGSAKERT